MSVNNLKHQDIVEVLQPSEILNTLDSNCTLDGLPFMPEMLKYCGKKYKVKFKIEKTCVSCLFRGNSVKNRIREFNFNDVVFLENTRCDGSFHDNCQESCMIFWKESWLRKSINDQKIMTPNFWDIPEFKNKLWVKIDQKKYYCQSTQLNQITKRMSVRRKGAKLVKELFTGDISLYIAIKSIMLPIYRKITYKKIFKHNPLKTQTESLNLVSGEIVEVKSFNEILKTLDKQGRNRGLSFYHDMKQYCGKRFRVRNRLEKMVNEATGEMMEVKNTVILEDVICSYEHSFLGCPRQRYQIWREIWLKRAPSI